MVAVLVALRFRSMWNSLQRSVWQMVGAAFGAVYGLGVLAIALVGFIGLSVAPLELARAVIVIAGSALIAGWAIGPLLIAGVEQTLDPAKLSTFPVPRRTLFSALTISGVLGIPGIATSIAVLLSAIVWWRHPLALIVSVLCSVVGVLTCVAASRALTTFSSGFSSGRRYRELMGVLIFIPLMMTGPIILWATSGAMAAADALPSIGRILSWTPLGAIWAVPGDVAAGAWMPAAARFLIALATLGVLMALWWSGLNATLSNPIRSEGARASRTGLGFFRWTPDSPLGAVMARSLTYWIRDPRYARQLLVVPLIVVLILVNTALGSGGSMGSFAIIFAAAFLPMTLYADIAMDSTAFALHITTGVRGVADRAGRALAVTLFSVPLLLVIAGVVTAITGDVGALPSTLGIALCLALAGFGAASVVSALFVFPVPGPGDNPFKSSPGSGLPSMVSMVITLGTATAVSVPAIVLGIIYIVNGAEWAGWLGLAVGVALGIAALAVGIIAGGRVYERRAPELFAKMRA